MERRGDTASSTCFLRVPPRNYEIFALLRFKTVQTAQASRLLMLAFYSFLAGGVGHGPTYGIYFASRHSGTRSQDPHISLFFYLAWMDGWMDGWMAIYGMIGDGTDGRAGGCCAGRILCYVSGCLDEIQLCPWSSACPGALGRCSPALLVIISSQDPLFAIPSRSHAPLVPIGNLSVWAQAAKTKPRSWSKET
jgi:hypothetical protein